MEDVSEAEKESLDAPAVHFVSLREFVSLLISRRRLERVWSRCRGSRESRAAVRDARTGELYVAELEPGASFGTSLRELPI